MKTRNLFFCAIASLMTIVSCDEVKQDLGAPKITIDKGTMDFTEATGEQTLAVTATRDWIADETADWIEVSPAYGEASAEPQTVTITVLPNTGMDREATVSFTIGMSQRTLTVKQTGPSGSPDALIIYINDYDKEEATKTFGKGDSWPYLDQFEGWKNQKGTGAANVEYSYGGMSARANSTSDSGYSDYTGSGKNNMFFGKNAYLATRNIALNGTKDITMTFGTEKYSQTLGNFFTNSEFHIWLSNDGAKWVELTDYTFAGTEGGRWNVASATFTVPEGTENLSVCMAVDAASSYRMDDLKLVVAETAGTAVDFADAVEKDFGAGSTGGGNTGGDVDYSNSPAKTVQEFITAADEGTYFKLTGTVSNFGGEKYCDFDLTDGTGTIYVYSVDNKADWSDKIANGGTVVLAGKYDNYNGKHEVVDAQILSFGEGSGEGGETTPVEATDVTVAEFLAAAESTDAFYRIKGAVGGPIEANGSFYVIDGDDKVYIYKASNASDFSLKVGGTVTITGNRGVYSGNPQMTNGKIETYDPSTETAVEPAKPIACTMIDKVANLAAGTYYMAGHLATYNTNDWSANPYHVAIGVGGNIPTFTYSYADGGLLKSDPSAADPIEVVLEAVDGKANTYYVKFPTGYLYSSKFDKAALAVSETAAEWVASDHSKGGIAMTTTLTEGDIILGTAGAGSNLLRSYKSPASSLQYGVVFFKK